MNKKYLAVLSSESLNLTPKKIYDYEPIRKIINKFDSAKFILHGGSDPHRESAIVGCPWVLFLWDTESNKEFLLIKSCIEKCKYIKIIPMGVPHTKTETDILGFTDKYRWLSNMWPCDLEISGEKFGSVENFYQASKVADPDLRKKVIESPAIVSKKLLQRYKIEHPEKLRDINRTETMEVGVKAKFYQNKYLAQKLLLTGNFYIEETNYWNDYFWGVCKGQGENNLGKILMDIRKTLSKN